MNAYIVEAVRTAGGRRASKLATGIRLIWQEKC
jgi:hypothetical protein